MTSRNDIILTRGDANDMALVAGMSLSGATVTLTAKHRPGDATAVMSKATPTGIEVTDAPGGLATVHILAADWDGYSGASDLVYDVEVTVGGEPTTVLVGRIRVVQDVTR